MALVETTLEESIGYLTLNRPEARNALSIEMCRSIVSALDDIDKMEDARVVVVRGNGPAFCSGADFGAVSGPAGLEFVVAFEEMLERVARHRLPTIAVLHGAALGGGLQLAIACDFRFAAADARIGIPSALLGILVNFENVRRLVLLVGVAAAKEILMTARVYSGLEAKSAGLVHRVIPEADPYEAAVETAREIATLSPLSVQGSKRAIQLIADDMSDPRRAFPADTAAIDALVAEAYASEDLQEGVRALQEKRPPHFTGH